jgi:hypothetical protein
VKLLPLAAVLVTTACRSRGAPPPPLALDATVSVADEAGAPPDPPVEARTIAVPDDLPAYFVAGHRGAGARFLFFHGACTNGLGYIQSFAFAAAARGSILALQGEHDCGGGLRLWTSGAASETRAGSMTAIGYSQGANVAESLAATYPEVYRRLVLIGQPRAVDAASLARLEGAVLMAGTYDNPPVMRESMRRLLARGVPATFIELPKARHGQLPDAERLMGEALAWLDANARPPLGAERDR